MLLAFCPNRCNFPSLYKRVKLFPNFTRHHLITLYLYLICFPMSVSQALVS